MTHSETADWPEPPHDGNGSDPAMASLVDSYTKELLQGARDDPETWLRARSPQPLPQIRAMTLLTGVSLLVRNRGVFGPASGATDPMSPSPEDGSPTISAPTAPGAAPISAVMNDRAWLNAHQLEPLGALDVPGGGMGSVVLAWHTRMKRELVLKVPQSPVYEQRFRREVELHARLEGHRNIAVTRSPLDYRGVTVLVVDYIPGLDLRRRVRVFGPLPWREAIDCVRQAAEGLGHAHALGIVHRDVKSSNLVRSERDGIVKVIDWGLARDTGGSLDVELTTAGAPIGTPLYCPPEQCRDARAATAESDLYGLGCVWYELLTGTPPFAGDRDQLVRDHASTPPPPLPAELGVPEEVEHVLRRMLAKDPAQRFPSVEAFLAAVDRAAGPPVSPLTRRWVVLGGATAAAVFFAWKLWPGRSAAVAPEVRKAAIVLDDTSAHPQGSGRIGETVYSARVRDQVVVQADLTSAGYCYLLAFWPDGTVSSWQPVAAGARVAATATLQFPPRDAQDQWIVLNHGEGLQVFALIVTREPLPDVTAWLNAQGGSPWRGGVKSDARVVWRDDGERIEPLAPGNVAISRGTDSSGGGAVTALTRWLKSRQGVEHTFLLGFAVRPAGE